MLKMGNRHVWRGTKKYDGLITLAEKLKQDKEALAAHQDDARRKEFVAGMILTEKKLEKEILPGS